MKVFEFIQRTYRVKALKNTLPSAIGTMAQNFFQENFYKQGFDDKGIKRWQSRRGEISGGIARVKKKTKGARAILVDTGNLRDGIYVKRATFSKITIASDAKYAKIHNEGLKGRAWGKHNFTMPKRQFMGESENLKKKIEAKIAKEIKKALLGR